MYYWLEFKNALGEWELENGYSTLSDAKDDKYHLIGSYAEWTPRNWLRNKDVRVRACRECTVMIACGPKGHLCGSV